MFITRVETVDGLLHVKVYANGSPLRLMAWCACPDTEQGRAAAAALAVVAGNLTVQTEPLFARDKPAGR